MAGEKVEVIEQEIEQKCIKALGHRGKPRRVLDRFDSAERAALAAIWDQHSDSLLSGQGAEFAAAFGQFWVAHNDRLDSLKATVDDSSPELPADVE